MKIWKYKLSLEETFTINMPKYAQIIHIEVQGGVPSIWVEVPSDSFYQSKKIEYEDRDFAVIGTGWEFGSKEIGNAGVYIGSWLDGPFVWHLYEYANEEVPYHG